MARGGTQGGLNCLTHALPRCLPTPTEEADGNGYGVIAGRRGPSRPPPRASVNLVPLLLTGVRLHPPGRTDKHLCRCFGAPATHARRPHGRVFPDHLITPGRPICVSYPPAAMESCSLVLGPLKLLCAAAPEASVAPPASAAPPAGASAATLGLLALLLLSPLLYLTLNTVLPVLLGTQDLRKKYGAKWALVTGSSSGIGKELARRLLAQGLSVVLVARKEAVFDATAAELQSSFPGLSVLKVEADLSDGEGKWMPAVEAAVSGKDVQVCLTRTLTLTLTLTSGWFLSARALPRCASSTRAI